jgi:hypothetical protein
MKFSSVINNGYIFLALLSSVIIATYLKVFPYIQNHYDFLIGFDSGKYVYDLIYLTSTGTTNIDLWVEPGFNTFLASLNTSLAIDPIFLFQYILPLVISVYFCVIIYLLTKSIIKSTFESVLSTFFFATSPIFVNAFFDSYYRQLFATMIFMAFLYFINKTVIQKEISGKTIVLSALLGAGIIMSHRAISLLYILTIAICYCLFFIHNKKIVQKEFFLSFLVALILSSVYWIFIVLPNLTILKDSVLLSLEGKSGGERIIKSLERSDNQIIGYLKSIGTSFLPFIGALFLLIKKRLYPFTYLVVLLIFYIFFRAIFANRFMLNLDLLFAVSSGVAIFFLNQKFNRLIVYFIAFSIIILNFLYSYDIAAKRIPYIPHKTASVTWVETNIPRDGTLIFAPDALSTILTSMGYRTTTYEFPLKGETQITKTEDFLIFGHQDLTIIDYDFSKFNNVYVIFGDWNIYNPFIRTNRTIPIAKWDNSQYAVKLYEGDAYIKRVYKIAL